LTDDDMRTVYAVSALLRSWGADVFVAATGLEALNVLERQPHIDMVLMDVMMPEMGGYETMRRIRQDARFAHLPIFALTASALKGERERCLDAGASEYLPKPLDSSQLLQLLQTWRQPKGSAA
jgi:CheY-like chemotaxis protein